MTLGKRIAWLRRRRRLSQGQLAEIVGVSRQIIYQYENDMTDPRLFTASCIADALGVSLDYLARGYEFNEKRSLL